MKPLPICVGFDGRETLAYHVFAHSIMKRSSIPVAITPLIQDVLRREGDYTRPIDTAAATEFSLTRFLVPFLADYKGLALFADCDMLMRGDVADIPITVPSRGELRSVTLGEVLRHETAYQLNDAPAVWVCQHDYVPANAVKMDGQVQAAYPRKNWSSFMLFNAAKCKALTPAYVNSATPKALHRFEWTDDAQIGSLPLSWNHLVGENGQSTDEPRNLHWTEGGCWFSRYADAPHSDEWRAELEDMIGAAEIRAVHPSLAAETVAVGG